MNPVSVVQISSAVDCPLLNRAYLSIVYTELDDYCLRMEDRTDKTKVEYLNVDVFELPGEPAVVINGVPTISVSCSALVLCNDGTDVEYHVDNGCGEWLVGREVRKLFGGQYYSGSVVEFDKENGWYRVLYEDGDSEDLEYHELEQALLPLDVTIPLKSLALSVSKKAVNPILKSTTDEARPGIQKVKRAWEKGRKIESIKEPHWPC